jgi:hypothetical protein
VCVALSRAKIGFYLLGNLDFLAGKCDLWRDIKRSLETVNAINRCLTIKCQLHGVEQVGGIIGSRLIKKITKIEKKSLKNFNFLIFQIFSIVKNSEKN